MTAMPTSKPPRLPIPLTPETIEPLMKARPYWDPRFPESEIYHRIVRRGFEIMYPVTRYDEFGRLADTPPLPPEKIAPLVAQENREIDRIEREFNGEDSASQDAGGEVHVQAHSRDGGKVEVTDYWRSKPGEGGEADSADDLPKPRNLLDEAENAVNEDGTEPTQAGTDDGPTSRSPVPNPVMRNDGAGGGYFGANREGGRKHQGIDIEAEPGDEVVSPGDGKVTNIAPAYKNHRFDDEFLAVEIKGNDENTYTLRYVAPTDTEGNPSIKEGDEVKAGDPIGTVQNRAARDQSGKMENHIHLEMKDKDKNIIDPTPYFERWQNEGKQSESPDGKDDQSSS